MPLLLLDLDNTLVDRDAAVRSWAQEFLADQPRFNNETEQEWMFATDDDGVLSREDFAAAICQRYRLGAGALAAEDIFAGVLRHLRLEPAVASALEEAVVRGWTPVVVTNGNTSTQEAKLYATGITEMVAGWVVSQAVGAAKPDPAIFHAAAAKADATLDGAWMMGDNITADIGGATALGLSTAWMRRGRQWEEADFAPTLTVETVDEAIRQL